MGRLRIPGPTPIPDSVRQALARQVIYHRSSEFSSLVSEIAISLRPLFGIDDDPVFLTASGTGGLEAALANTIGPGDKVLALDNGHWGARFGRLAAALGAGVELQSSPWGTAPDADALRRRLAEPGGEDIAAVLVAHNDTFTGVVADLAAIGDAMRGHPALLLVDAVSSVGTMPVEARKWGLDVVVTATQKGLMCPPGLAVLAISDKAWKRIEARTVNGEYWDLKRAGEMAGKRQTVFTPAVSVLFGLREALRIIHEKGIHTTFDRHRLLSNAFQKGIRQLGLRIFAPKDVASPSVGVVCLPDGVQSADMVRLLDNKFGTVITGARRSRLDGKVIRVGTMGHCEPDDIRLDVLQIGSALREFGHHCDVGNAVNECESVLLSGEDL